MKGVGRIFSLLVLLWVLFLGLSALARADSNPRIVGSVDTPGGNSVGIYVLNGYVFLADWGEG